MPQARGKGVERAGSYCIDEERDGPCALVLRDVGLSVFFRGLFGHKIRYSLCVVVSFQRCG